VLTGRLEPGPMPASMIAPASPFLQKPEVLETEHDHDR
jgi:hypothetical protein